MENQANFTKKTDARYSLAHLAPLPSLIPPMNAAHLHLMLNHLPILGLFFGLVILAFGLLRKQGMLKRTGLILLVFAMAITLPVNSTGEEAEEIVERMPDRSSELIHDHEEAADTALWLMLLTGGLSIGALVMLSRSHQRAHLLTSATLGLGVLVFIWMVQVANLGGRISHPEIRPGYQVSVQSSEEEPERTRGEGREPADRDDD